MNTIKTWEERITSCGRVSGGHGGGEPCGLSNIFCSECRNKAKDAEIEEYRALAASATPAQPVPEKLAQPKPCPRCENDAPTINSSASVRLSEIHCGDCGFVLQRPVDEDAIITIWNVLPRQMTDEKISQFIENADGVRCVDGEYRIEGRDLMNLVREIIKEVAPTGAFQPSPSSVGAAITDQKITDLADDNDCGRTAKGYRLFSDRNLMAFSRALLSEAAALAEQVQGRQWLPIESAPKDGTNIVLTNGKDVAQGWWEHQEPYICEQRDTEGNYIDQQEHDGFDGWLDVDGGMGPDPTHWMPLPAAPSIAQDGQKSEADRGD